MPDPDPPPMTGRTSGPSRSGGAACPGPTSTGSRIRTRRWNSMRSRRCPADRDRPRLRRGTGADLETLDIWRAPATSSRSTRLIDSDLREGETRRAARRDRGRHDLGRGQRTGLARTRTARLVASERADPRGDQADAATSGSPIGSCSDDRVAAILRGVIDDLATATTVVAAVEQVDGIDEIRTRRRSTVAGRSRGHAYRAQRRVGCPSMSARPHCPAEPATRPRAARARPRRRARLARLCDCRVQSVLDARLDDERDRRVASRLGPSESADADTDRWLRPSSVDMPRSVPVAAGLDASPRAVACSGARQGVPAASSHSIPGSERNHVRWRFANATLRRASSADRRLAVSVAVEDRPRLAVADRGEGGQRRDRSARAGRGLLDQPGVELGPGAGRDPARGASSGRPRRPIQATGPS